MTTERWEDLYRQTPEELRRYLPPFRWDHERLWALHLPVEQVAVEVLEWQLGLPWWRMDGKVFALRPCEVLIDPKRYPQAAARLQHADLTYPISLTLRRGRWFILDGVHRLAKARALALPAISAQRVPAATLRELILRA